MLKMYKNVIEKTIKLAFIGCLVCSLSSTAYAARARACGVELYNQNSGPQCGASAFRQGVGSGECGNHRIEKWSPWGDGCGSVIEQALADIPVGLPGAASVSIARGLIGVLTGDSETRVHRSGWAVTIQTRTLCKFDIPNVCRHPNFGIESFNTCRHPDFGIELYQDCAIMTEEEVSAYINMTNTWLPATAQSYALAVATFESRQNNEASMACLIRDYEGKKLPFIAELVARLKDIYRTSFNKEYVSGVSDCAAGSSAVQNILAATPNGDALRDQALATFRQSRAMLEGQLATIQRLMQDVVAQSNTSFRDGLAEIQTQISATMNQ